jgi:hypothetical protein
MLGSDEPLGIVPDSMIFQQVNIVADDIELGIENSEIVLNSRMPFFNNRLIDFGEEGIEVNDIFYNWFLENSITIENFEAAIAQSDVQIFGKWLWNNTIPFPFNENFMPESNSLIGISVIPFAAFGNILVAGTNCTEGYVTYNDNDSYYEAFLAIEGVPDPIVCYTNNQWIDPTTSEPSEEY